MLHSPAGNRCWEHLESYFPQYQLFLTTANGEVVGFANTIPFYRDQPLADLPDTGWDWLIQQEIHDFENQIQT